MDTRLSVLRTICWPRICRYALAGMVSFVASSAAMSETRGYAISIVHTATYSNDDNCPKGGMGGVVQIKQRAYMSLGYTKEQAEKLLATNGVDEKGQKVDPRKRGRVADQAVDIHSFPMSVPDPGIETVTGRYAYGFNLDGKVRRDAFEDPETHGKGVDNQMWRVLGCFDVYAVRRPVVPYSESIAWDTAMDSMPAWLISISGDDLGKDGPVTVTFVRALNILMRDARSEVLHGSSYTIDSDPRSQSIFKGHIKDGMVSIEPGDFSMQGESQFYAVLRFKNTHLRLRMNPNGTLSGIIGGYQPWLDFFHFLAVRGEESGQVDMPGVYYAMKRLADADPDPETGQNRAISAAYYLEAAPAFLTTRTRETLAVAHMGEALLTQESTIHP